MSLVGLEGGVEVVGGAGAAGEVVGVLTPEPLPLPLSPGTGGEGLTMPGGLTAAP